MEWVDYKTRTVHGFQQIGRNTKEMAAAAKNKQKRTLSAVGNSRGKKLKCKGLAERQAEETSGTSRVSDA